jgi:hypothetical protein
MVQHDLVVAIRADCLHSLAKILLFARAEAENHHHHAIQPSHRAPRFTHRRVIVRGAGNP